VNYTEDGILLWMVFCSPRPYNPTFSYMINYLPKRFGAYLLSSVQKRSVSDIKHKYITWKMLTEVEVTPTLKNLLVSVDALKLDTKWKVNNPTSLFEWHRIKLTYTSNALEGSTLSEFDIAKFIETL